MRDQRRQGAQGREARLSEYVASTIGVEQVDDLITDENREDCDLFHVATSEARENRGVDPVIRGHASERNPGRERSRQQGIELCGQQDPADLLGNAIAITAKTRNDSSAHDKERCGLRIVASNAQGEFTDRVSISCAFEGGLQVGDAFLPRIRARRPGCGGIEFLRGDRRLIGELTATRLDFGRRKALSIALVDRVEGVLTDQIRAFRLRGREVIV